MSKINYEIKTRGAVLVHYNDKQLCLSGELVFEPPAFYADKDSILEWEPPFYNEEITNEEKIEIINFIAEDSKADGKMVIIFD